ncbi:MAG: hypothetical protein KGS09_09145 [Nitrospirae bacterium]|nr:hypothetical protein [Nitrospirota bacterium]
MEKPTCDHAGRLTREGWLWNTMDVVARAQSLFDPTVEAAPHLAGSFSMIRPAIGAHWEQLVVEDVYRTMRPPTSPPPFWHGIPNGWRCCRCSMCCGAIWAEEFVSSTRLGVPVPSRTAADSSSIVPAAAGLW